MVVGLNTFFSDSFPLPLLPLFFFFILNNPHRLLESTEIAEKKVVAMTTRMQDEKDKHERDADKMVTDHQEHVSALRKTHTSQLKRMKEECREEIAAAVASHGKGHGKDGRRTESESTLEGPKEEERHAKENIILKSVRYENKRLEGCLNQLEASQENLRKIHAARMTEVLGFFFVTFVLFCFCPILLFC